MEDQTLLKALVEESVKEANGTLSKELAEIRSMLLEVVGNKAVMGTHCSDPTIASMFLPRFSGDGNPESWIFRAELYFTYLGFDEKDWLPLPSFYLDGEALTWFNWLFRNKLFFDWMHFKDRFAQHFRQQTNRDVLGYLTNPSQIHLDCVSSVPIVSQSVVASSFSSPSHFSKSSTSISAYNTGSSQADHVFDKLPMKYKYVESALITKNNTEVEPLAVIATPQFENVNSVEVNLVHEPSSIIEDHVFDEIPRTTVSSNIHDLKAIIHEVENFVTTTVANVYNNGLSKDTKTPIAVLHDTNGSNNEEENSHDNVALFDKSTPLITSGLLVSFAFHGIVMLNTSSRLAEIYPIAGALWLRTISGCHNSLEEFHRGSQNEVSLCLEFRLHKCNWVDTGQECTLLGFLLYDIGAHWKWNRLALSLGSVLFGGQITGSAMVTGYTFYGILELIEWVACQKLHHGFDAALVFVILMNKCVIARQVIPELHLIMSNSYTVNQREHGCNWLISVPMERFGGRRASNTICRYFMVNIAIDRKRTDTMDEWSMKGIVAPVSHTCIALLDISHIITHPCHVIPRPSKTYAIMSRLLQAANQILILFLHGFSCSSRVYYTPSYRMTFPDLNLEDKVLFGGGCIVVNQTSSIRAYELEVVNEVGPSKMLEHFIWDPGPISIAFG